MGMSRLSTFFYLPCLKVSIQFALRTLCNLHNIYFFIGKQEITWFPPHQIYFLKYLLMWRIWRSGIFMILCILRKTWHTHKCAQWLMCQAQSRIVWIANGAWCTREDGTIAAKRVGQDDNMKMKCKWAKALWVWSKEEYKVCGRVITRVKIPSRYGASVKNLWLL